MTLLPLPSKVRSGQDTAIRGKEDAMDPSRVTPLVCCRARRITRRTALGVTLAALVFGTWGRGARAVATPAPGATPGARTRDWATVEELIRDAEAAGGVVGVAIHGADGERFVHHGDRRFHAASTIKVPILIAAYRQVERGALSLDDRYRLRDEDRVPGSGVLGTLHAGLNLTVADLLYLMITVSDNTATNLIIDRVGMDVVNATMRSLGMTDSVLGRRILGRLPAAGDPENWAAPQDFAVAVEAIVSGQAASAESCQRMRETLEQQGEIRRISRFIPDGTDARWGSKPGDLAGVVNDVGFVTSDRGTLSLAVFCEDLPNLDVAERTIGVIAREALALTGIVPPGADAPS
jgi:beta-lactamase class A